MRLLGLQYRLLMTLQAVSRYKCQYRKVLGFKPFLLFYILSYVITRYIIRRKGMD